MLLLEPGSKKCTYVTVHTTQFVILISRYEQQFIKNYFFSFHFAYLYFMCNISVSMVKSEIHNTVCHSTDQT